MGVLRTLTLLGVVLFLSSPLQSQDRDILFEGVTVIDGTGRAAITDAYVLVQGDRIARLTQQPITADGAQRVNGRGKYLIPGLMDAHIHLTGSFGAGGPDERAGIRALHGFLYSGVTSVFDAGNDPDYILGLRAQERAGEILSPRIFATGALVTVPGGHGGRSTATLVSSWPEAIPKLDAHIARSPDMVKLTFDEHGWGTRPLIPLLPVDLMSKVGAYFNEHGIRTTVHISHEYRARQAIEAGINTLAHPIIQGPVSEGFVNLMATRQVPMVSTLTIGEGYSRLVEHPEFLDEPLYRAIFEPERVNRLRTEVRDEYAQRPWTTWMKIMTPIAQENLRKINAAGGVIVLGSDQSSGPAAHRELELMVAGGIEPIDAIRIGTLNAAIFLGMENDLGSIEEGKIADLVLLGADPLANIANIHDVEMVIKAGIIVNRDVLDLPLNR